MGKEGGGEGGKEGGIEMGRDPGIYRGVFTNLWLKTIQFMDVGKFHKAGEIILESNGPNNSGSSYRAGNSTCSHQPK